MSEIKVSNELTKLLREHFTWEEIVANQHSGYIATEIELWRHENGMSQKDLANYIGVPLRKVKRWESGEYNFRLKELAKLWCMKVVPEPPIYGKRYSYMGLYKGENQ